MIPYPEIYMEIHSFDPGLKFFKWEELIKKGGLLLRSWLEFPSSLIDLKTIIQIRENLLHILKGKLQYSIRTSIT